MSDPDPSPRSPQAPASKGPDWLEEIDEGDLTDWMEDSEVQPGDDPLAGVLRRIQIATRTAPKDSFTASAGGGETAPRSTSPRSVARGADRGSDQEGPKAAFAVGMVPPLGGFTGESSLPLPRSPPDAEVAELRKELQTEQRRRQELEGLLAAAQTELKRQRSVATSPSSLPPSDPLSQLRREVEEARLRLELARTQDAEEEARASHAAPRLAVPVGFLGFDGRSMVGRACFAVGKGETLHSLLGSFLHQWQRWPYPLVAGVTPRGLVVQLPRDPQRRSIRILPTGVILLQMGPKYLDYVRELPPFVSRASG